MDYRYYKCNLKEYAGCTFAALAAAGLISWLFYRSWYAMCLALPAYLLLCKAYQKREKVRRKEQLLLEFKDGMQAVSTALQAGYSMENAWREAEKELRESCGKDCMMYQEFSQMNAAVRMNEPLEKVLADFARRSGCEEIESFSEIFSFAKRSGGSFPGIIQTTVGRLSGRIEVMREISTVVAGKKLEGRIMSGMPLFILAYMNLTSGDFLDVLYGNPAGAILMSGALVVYALAVKMSEHILDIQI